ncbi:MAG: TetR family transcriptional regulator [Bacteroidetes bacterium]|nr:TetR family transcriptional regulator [Bacteroidota bacterium]
MDKKEQILEAAEALFAEHGFEGTSVRKLAKKARINVAMVSYYFGSKEKLFKALVEYRAGTSREQLMELSRKEYDPMTRIEKLVDLYVDRIFDNHRFHKILQREIALQQRSKMHEVIVDILMRNMNEIRKMIEEGQRKKVFRKVDIECTIATLIGTISQVTKSSMLACKMINLDPETNSIFDEKNKTRVKKHLRDILKNHLLIRK